jgi:hypothetical protein
VKNGSAALTRDRVQATFTCEVTPTMDEIDFDGLAKAYRQAVDQWVDAIRAEEALVTPDHSMTQMEHWDQAGLNLHDAELRAKKARDEYKNALRKKNYGF